MDNNHAPVFSVVMPTYGVEAYIAYAIESILNQSFQDFEIIVVNDKTKDKSAEIAEKYAAKDSRIRVVNHEVNRGLSAARNTGIAEAKGSYIWFMDPDDTVDLNLLRTVNQSIAENPADLILFGLNEEYYNEDGSFSYRHTIKPSEHRYRKGDELRDSILALETETLYGYAWNKMYRLSYLKELGLLYEDVRLIEDIVFNIKFCMDIGSMNTLAIAPYHYAKRISGNLTNKFVPDYYELHRRRIEMLWKQQKYWGLGNIHAKEVLGSLYARYILSAIQRNCDKRSKMNGRDRKVFVQTIFCDSLFTTLLPYARANDSRLLKLWIKILNSKKLAPCLFMGRCVDIAKNRLPMLYNRSKSGR